jgi:hypothetical protein
MFTVTVTVDYCLVEKPLSQLELIFLHSSYHFSEVVVAVVDLNPIAWLIMLLSSMADSCLIMPMQIQLFAIELFKVHCPKC